MFIILSRLAISIRNHTVAHKSVKIAAMLCNPESKPKQSFMIEDATLMNRQTTRVGATRLTVDDSCNGQRIDNFLLSRYRHLPKSYIYRIIRSGEVRRNSKRIKPHDKIHTDDVIRIPPIEEKRPHPPQISEATIHALQQQIIFEHEDFIVINKPANVAAHAGTGNNYGLIDIVKKMRPQNDIALTHRIDKGVSGCLVIAKTRQTLLSLHQAFRDGTVGKTYLALVIGRWDQPRTIDSKLMRKAQKQTVDADGKTALSHFEPQDYFGDYTLVRVRILTGRTHQIRVHAAQAGHPVAGDRKYGDFKKNRQLEKRGLKRIFLHASQLTFNLDGEQDYSFEAPLDEELQNILRAL